MEGGQISLLGRFGSHFLAKIETVISRWNERSIKSWIWKRKFPREIERGAIFLSNVVVINVQRGRGGI